MPQFIDDGYTIDGYIKPAEANDAGQRLHDGLRVSYRVATKPEWLRLDNQLDIMEQRRLTDPDTTTKMEKLACEFVAKHVVNWDLVDRQNNAIPVTADACLRLNSAVFSKLYRMVRGTELGDAIPPAEIAPVPIDLAKN